MNGWMDGWMNEWLNDWMSEWLNEWVSEWMSEWIKNIAKMDKWKYDEWTILLSIMHNQIKGKKLLRIIIRFSVPEKKCTLLTLCIISSSLRNLTVVQSIFNSSFFSLSSSGRLAATHYEKSTIQIQIVREQTNKQIWRKINI